MIGCSRAYQAITLMRNLCVSVVVGALWYLLGISAFADTELVRFDIAAQPLPFALNSFATQAHMQILYEHNKVVNILGNAVSGVLDKHIALEQLLRGTGLEAIYSAENAATIRLKSN